MAVFHHPHVHLLVPAGGVSQDGEWLAARRDYLVPVKALSLIFRGMFIEMLRKALPQQQIPNSVRNKKWHVYCEPTVQGAEKVLQYLGRYVHRTAFANSRLVRIKDGRVTFRYKVRRQRQWKTMTLCAMEFIRRFLQHVLPRGTHKVRYYGIWHPSQRSLLCRVQLVTGLPEIPSATEEEATSQTDGAFEESSQKRRKCPCCTEGTLVLAKTLPRRPRPPP